MKKICFALLAGLLLLQCLSLAAAEEPFVTDDPGLLSKKQVSALTKAARETAEETGFGIYILLTDRLDYYCDTDDLGRAAGVVYANYQLGIGEEKNGLLLLVDTQGRRYGLYAFGYGNTAFTDYGKEVLGLSFRSYFAADNWYEGLRAYMNDSRKMLLLAQEGTPVEAPKPSDRPVRPEERAAGVVFCMIPGLIIAFIVRGRLKRQLRSVAYARNANDFVCDGAVELEEHWDRYTHTSTSRRYDPPDRDSGSGGTTLDSRGGSSSSGSF